jgi:glutaredoxin-related protein
LQWEGINLTNLADGIALFFLIFESCVDLLFIKGSGACPECGTALRRNNFRLQLFEDPYIEKEIDIRKKILRE